MCIYSAPWGHTDLVFFPLLAYVAWQHHSKFIDEMGDIIAAEDCVLQHVVAYLISFCFFQVLKNNERWTELGLQPFIDGIRRCTWKNHKPSLQNITQTYQLVSGIIYQSLLYT